MTDDRWQPKIQQTSRLPPRTRFIQVFERDEIFSEGNLLIHISIQVFRDCWPGCQIISRTNTGSHPHPTPWRWETKAKNYSKSLLPEKMKQTLNKSKCYECSTIWSMIFLQSQWFAVYWMRHWKRLHPGVGLRRITAIAIANSTCRRKCFVY